VVVWGWLVEPLCARTCVEWGPLTATPLPLPEEKKNGSPLPANIDAASSYYKAIVPGELENEVVQTQIGGISTE
jgi:hypothetical protein